MVIDNDNLHVENTHCLFTIRWKPKLDVKKSTFDPSKLMLSLVYQDIDFALKSPRTTIIKDFFQPFD